MDKSDFPGAMEKNDDGGQLDGFDETGRMNRLDNTGDVDVSDDPDQCEYLIEEAFDIVEDFWDELEIFVRLGKLGHFKEAREYYATNLEPYDNNFPVVAEYADLLLEQGDYNTADSFLNAYVRRDLSSQGFGADETTFIGLLLGFATMHSKCTLNNARELAMAARRTIAHATPETISDVQIQILIYCSRIFECPPYQTEFEPSRLPWIDPECHRDMFRDQSIAWVDYLLRQQRLWEARPFIESLLRWDNVRRAHVITLLFSVQRIVADESNMLDDTVLAHLALFDSCCKGLLARSRQHEYFRRFSEIKDFMITCLASMKVSLDRFKQCSTIDPSLYRRHLAIYQYDLWLLQPFLKGSAVFLLSPPSTKARVRGLEYIAFSASYDADFSSHLTVCTRQCCELADDALLAMATNITKQWHTCKDTLTVLPILLDVVAYLIRFRGAEKDVADLLESLLAKVIHHIGNSSIRLDIEWGEAGDSPVTIGKVHNKILEMGRPLPDMPSPDFVRNRIWQRARIVWLFTEHGIRTLATSLLGTLLDRIEDRNEIFFYFITKRYTRDLDKSHVHILTQCQGKTVVDYLIRVWNSVQGTGHDKDVQPLNNVALQKTITGESPLNPVKAAYVFGLLGSRHLDIASLIALKLSCRDAFDALELPSRRAVFFKRESPETIARIRAHLQESAHCARRNLGAFTPDTGDLRRFRESIVLTERRTSFDIFESTWMKS